MTERKDGAMRFVVEHRGSWWHAHAEVWVEAAGRWMLCRRAGGARAKGTSAAAALVGSSDALERDES